MFSQKSESLALNTIVIAALVIIVLVVLIAIFSGKIGLFGKSIEDCRAKGGGDPVDKDFDCGDKKIKVPMKQEGKYCCIPFEIN